MQFRINNNTVKIVRVPVLCVHVTKAVGGWYMKLRTNKIEVGDDDHGCKRSIKPIGDTL